MSILATAARLLEAAADRLLRTVLAEGSVMWWPENTHRGLGEDDQ